MENRHPLQQMLLGKVVICLENSELDPCLSPCTSINSNKIMDHNITAGNTLETIGISKDFL
jgi:hypothetical protein